MHLLDFLGLEIAAIVHENFLLIGNDATHVPVFFQFKFVENFFRLCFALHF